MGKLWTKPYRGYFVFALKQNIRNQKVFAIALSVICFLLLVDNEVPIFPLHLDDHLTYYNISLIFFVVFLLQWLLLKVSDFYPKIGLITSWCGLVCCISFINILSYIELREGHGLTAFALGTITLAVVASSYYPTLISIIIANGIFLYFWVSQIPGLQISQYRMAIVGIIILGVTVFITVETQRRKVFETQEKLAGKVDELNKALDIKSVFFGHMSHELRTPLNAIIGFSEMILNDAYQPKTIAKIKEYTKLINAGGTHLLKIVNDILDSTKIEAGEIKVEFEKINLCKILPEYVKELSSITLDKQQQVRFIMQEDKIELRSDRRLLKQIIFNLISNAQKFTESGGLIEISVMKNEAQSVDIIVKDNGKGMNEEQLNAINEKSTSAQSHFITNAEGTGLGLVIVRQLVKLLKGSIQFTSEPDLGTEIKMSFPA